MGPGDAMNQHQIYEELKLLAERLGITVSEQNFRVTGVQAKSGLCTVRRRMMFIMDKHHALQKKNELLIDCLKQLPHENVYVVPTIRELLDME
ncbi:MAG: hypothetical protein JEZ11_11935 [Desulfobacterales bacterium]|nr:hypothetical protein [Desulfobacterales bacterium]